MLRGYKVRVFHTRKDKIFDYFIPLNEAVQQGSRFPQRSVAVAVAKRRCADECGEEYVPRVFTILNVEEK